MRSAWVPTAALCLEPKVIPHFSVLLLECDKGCSVLCYLPTYVVSCQELHIANVAVGLLGYQGRHNQLTFLFFCELLFH